VWLHALNVRVDVEGPVAALDGMKNEANVVSRTHTLNVSVDLEGPVAALDGMKSEAVSTGR
jgi:hypothetical protein